MDATYNGKIEIEYKYITIDEFLSYSLDDVNYSGILFIFGWANQNQVFNKLEFDWNINKMYRWDNVKIRRMFYIENADLQDVDDELTLLSLLNNDIKHIYVIDDDTDDIHLLFN